jgi:hypothetical protein
VNKSADAKTSRAPKPEASEKAPVAAAAPVDETPVVESPVVEAPAADVIADESAE